jgi:hypothetical protein
MVKVRTHLSGNGEGQMQMGHIQQFLRNTTHSFIGTDFATQGENRVLQEKGTIRSS